MKISELYHYPLLKNYFDKVYNTPIAEEWRDKKRAMSGGYFDEDILENAFQWNCTYPFVDFWCMLAGYGFNHKKIEELLISHGFFSRRKRVFKIKLL